MAVAAGSGAGGGISRPKKPKPVRPDVSHLPVRKPYGRLQFNPTVDISGGRVAEGRSITPAPASKRVGRDTHITNLASTQPDSDYVLFSALANLLARRKPEASSDPSEDYTLTSAEGRPVGQSTPSYSNYADMMDRENAYSAAPTSPVKVWQPEPLTPERTGIDGLRKQIARRLSRRGGQGIVNPASPIAGYEMGENYDSDFGPRVHPIDGGLRTHTGDDISKPMGTPIYAPVGGVVSTATSQGGAYGNQIIMDHGKGEQTMYGHLAEIAVEPGTRVKKGDVIGFVGSTGYSTGPHLHYETWENGQPVDPSAQYADNDQQLINQVLQRRLKRNPQMQNVAAETPPQEPQEAPTGVLGALGQALAPKTPEEYYESRSFWEVPTGNEDTQPVPGNPQPQQSQSVEGYQLARNPQLNALLQAIREQESGGDYGVQNGIGARGAYQIMPSNIDGPGGWDMEALGAEITGQEFLANPVLQDKIAKFKLRDYFKNYGAAGAAKAWYAGPGNADLNSDAPQYGGPSVNDYADSVLRIMQKYMPQG